ncbi:YIP1 family protein [Aliiglaciecola litoralis]|uniref:Yip1 domain-containing protein n=1 Tax=Aliiglaciecola litoralis TaxID=582857 RepID=A0ABN1LNL0_9ALTE
MNGISNPFQACLHIWFNPKTVFAAVDKHHNWSWIPFFIVMLGVLLPTYAYFQFVDFDWYREFYVAFTAGDVSPAEKEAVLVSLRSQSVYMYSNMFAYCLGYVLLAAIIAGYLNMMTKVDEENINGFTDWYGFVWWTFLPVFITGVVMLLMILIKDDNQTSLYGLQPLSLGYWLGLNETSKWVGLADQFRVELFLSFYFMITGLKQWTRLSILRIYLILFVPYILIVGSSIFLSFYWASA